MEEENAPHCCSVKHRITSADINLSGNAVEAEKSGVVGWRRRLWWWVWNVQMNRETRAVGVVSGLETISALTRTVSDLLAFVLGLGHLAKDCKIMLVSSFLFTLDRKSFLPQENSLIMGTMHGRSRLVEVKASKRFWWLSWTWLGSTVSVGLDLGLALTPIKNPSWLNLS